MKHAGKQPFVSLIVPVTGYSPDLEANLTSLARQQYEPFSITFVLQDRDDPALKVVESLTMQYDHVKVVFSGRATGCSQKNHNLLAGVRTCTPQTAILAFCDSGHNAPPKWLHNLLLPLLPPATHDISSGYHQIYPEKAGIVSQGRAICVLSLNLIRQIPGLGQPWGGATTISKTIFEKYGVAALWEKSVVDDVTLAKLLAHNNIDVAIPKGHEMQTKVTDLSFAGWSSWLTRQWAYLKFVFPLLWLGAGICTLSILCGMIITFLLCGISLLSFSPHPLLPYCLTNLAAFLLFAGFLYWKHPSPGSSIHWFPATIAALAMAGYCHGKTWFSQSIHWAGIRYRVGKNGRVLAVIRPKKHSPTRN